MFSQGKKKIQPKDQTSNTKKSALKRNTRKLSSAEKMKTESLAMSVLSSESDEDENEETEKNLLRKVSTKKQLHSKACIKEGYLLKQTSLSFQRWRRRYFKLRPRRLFYAKHENSEIFDEIDLTDSSVAEKSTKKVNCSFSVIGPSYNIILCAESRKEMDEWISAIKAVQSREFYSPQQVYMDNFSDGHSWYACTHNRPTYCNVCREVLSSVMNHGLSCDVCKFKAHKRCAAKATINCKWTTLATVGKNIIENEDGLWIPHQWLEGNLPVSAKCAVCDRTCGSVLRMQDWRCLWCRTVVHTACRSQLPTKCTLGSCKLSIVPPTAIHSQDSDDLWQAVPSSSCNSPLLVFVNSKSGDNQGVKFLRRFRQFLNPAQVFDLMCSGPHVGLQMFRKFDLFRILICGGDGSVGWVLSEMDKLNLSSKAQVGVLPLGTGNDLAQVMGWGNMCDDDTQVPSIIEKYERASAKLLDRWSILAYEGKLPLTIPTPVVLPSTEEDFVITEYEDTVADHLGAILNSDKTSKVVSSAAVLCETVKDFVTKVGRTYSNDDNSDIPLKCRVLEEKLASLLDTLTLESKMAEIEQKDDVTEVVFHPCSVASESANAKSEPDVNEEQSKSDADAAQIENLSKLEDDQPTSSMSSELLQTVSEAPSSQEINGNTNCQAEPSNEDVASGKPFPKKTPKKRVFEQRTQLMLRANSLKKAVRQIIEHTENAVDEQNEQTRQFTIHEEEDVGEATVVSTDSDKSTSFAPDVDTKSVEKEATLSNSSEKLLLPLMEHKSKSAPTTPTSTLEAPRFQKFSRQASVAHPYSAKSCDRQDSTQSYGLVPLSQFRKSSTAINPLYSPCQRNAFLSRVLLANADALCAPATPLLQADESAFRSLYTEKCVMNNYFGIGLDAKITLEFHRKREDNPKKCSRTKNIVWYGMLATKEIAVKSYKNLEQRIRLECDGQYIPLPPLQGIVVLNIPSYAGGRNVWGSRSANEIFMAPSYNDKVLEVVAVFSTVQLGMACVVPDGVIQHHRIAQCKSLKITILGDEPVPLQTDGEAWLQPPGIVKIEHKNRVQMLARDRRLEVALKAWEVKHRYGSEKNLPPGGDLLTDNEVFMVGQLAETANTIAASLNESVSSNNLLKEELLPVASTILRLNVKLRPNGRVSNTASRQLVAEFVNVVRDLALQLELFRNKHGDQLTGELVAKSETWLNWLDLEIKKIQGIKWLSQSEQKNATEAVLDASHSSKQTGRGSTRAFKLFKKGGKKDSLRQTSSLDSDVVNWTCDDVGAWLESYNLQTYRENFANHSISGKELLSLEASSLKEIGVVKPDHVKKILSAIKKTQ